MDHLKTKRAAKDSSDESSSSDGSTGFSYKHFRPRKKPVRRRQDAGRRYHGGRMYDSQLGITCHFCRQKTTVKHVLCRTCVLALCGNCLRNRHGEDIEIEAPDDDDDSWLCPKCRGGCGPGCKICCNCTFCRKKQGLKPPKISFGEMHGQGFDNVHDYLIHLETGESPESISARKSGKGWCRTHEKRPPSNPHQNSHMHQRREKKTSRGSDEVANSATNTHQNVDGAERERPMSMVEDKVMGREGQCPPPRIPKEPLLSQCSSRAGFNEQLGAKHAASCAADMRQNVNDAESERPLSRVEDILKGSKLQCPCPPSPVPKESLSSQFSSRNCLNEKLKANSAANTCQNGNYAESVGKAGEKFKGSKAQGPPPTVSKESFPSQFSSRNRFKEKLVAKLAEPFNAQELNNLWEAIKCRKPLCKKTETPHGTFSLPTKEPGYSYSDHHPDLARAITATGEREVRLKLLRGFFFWLEHASMPGSFKPWIENDTDDDCFELDGPDCKVLGVLLNVDDDDWKSNRTCLGENLEDTEPNRKREFVENLSSQAKPTFNWDAVDIKPNQQEGWVKILAFNSQIQVKEELDAP